MELAMSAGMKAADKEAIERGVDSLLLMERAAGFVAAAAAEYREGDGAAVLFCGMGNNGGDGIAAARLLKQRNIPVRVFLVGPREKMTPDTRAMEAGLAGCGVVPEAFSADTAADAVKHAGVIVDALFGVGLNRPLSGDMLEAVRLMDGARAPVVAADIASGVSADNGQIWGQAVHAACTVTFTMPKVGHFIEPGCVYCGELRVCDIGIPAEISRKAGCGVYAIHAEDLRLPKRARLSHKGDHGKLLILGGCKGYTGAPSLCAQAAVRAGAGLVWLGVPEEIYTVTAVKNDEAMPFAQSETEVAEKLRQCDVCVIGPGMGRSETTKTLTRYVLQNAGTRPVVADADALWVLAEEPELFGKTDAALVLTPHEGEFARLLGRPVRDRLNDAGRFARENGCAVVLKGHRTICAFPDGKVYVIDAGNPGMAKGGSGDVLAGMIGAMLGQLTCRRAVVTACWLHARTGDIAAGKFGEYALKAGDLIDTMYRAELEITE